MELELGLDLGIIVFLNFVIATGHFLFVCLSQAADGFEIAVGRYILIFWGDWV